MKAKILTFLFCLIIGVGFVGDLERVNTYRGDLPNIPAPELPVTVGHGRLSVGLGDKTYRFNHNIIFLQNHVVVDDVYVFPDYHEAISEAK